MPMITRLETTLKTDGNLRELDFNKPNILLTGDNGSGKTAVLNSLELCLKGEAFDIGAKDSAKSPAFLSKLISPSMDHAYAKLWLKDGRSASWSIERGKAPKWEPLEDCKVTLPVHEAYDAIKGSKDKLIAYLYKLAPIEKDAFLESIAKTRVWCNSTNAEVKKIQTFLDHLSVPKKPLPQFWPFEEEDDLRKWEVMDAIEKLFISAPDALSEDIRKAGHDHFQNKIQELFKQEREHVLGGSRGKPTWVNGLYPSTRPSPDTARLARIASIKLREKKELLARHKLSLTRQLETCGEVVQRHNAQICAFINRWLPRPISIRVLDKQCEFGWLGERNKILPFTSGAETVQIAAALGMCHTSPSPKNVAVIITPDKNLDSYTLRNLQKNLGDGFDGCNCFIQTLRPPRGRPSAKWQTIELSRRRIEF